MTPLSETGASLWMVGGYGRQRSYPSPYRLACAVDWESPLIELSPDALPVGR